MPVLELGGNAACIVANCVVVIGPVGAVAAAATHELRNGAHALKAHNRRYPLIRPEGVWHIFGVMVGLVRRYQRY